MENHVGQRVMQLRTALKMTQAEFAAAVGMHQVGVWKIEQGGTTPRRSTLTLIAGKFNVPVEWLASGAGEMGEPFFKAGTQQPPQQLIQNPWENAMVQELKDQVEFYKEIIRNLTGKQTANFLKAIGLAGSGDGFTDSVFPKPAKAA